MGAVCRGRRQRAGTARAPPWAGRVVPDGVSPDRARVPAPPDPSGAPPTARPRPARPWAGPTLPGEKRVRRAFAALTAAALLLSMLPALASAEPVEKFTEHTVSAFCFDEDAAGRVIAAQVSASDHFPDFAFAAVDPPGDDVLEATGDAVDL